MNDIRWSNRTYRWALREQAWRALYGPRHPSRAANLFLDAVAALGLNRGEEERVRRIIAELDPE